MYELIVYKKVGSREYVDLAQALVLLEPMTLFHGQDSLGRVVDKETGDIINEYNQPNQEEDS